MIKPSKFGVVEKDGRVWKVTSAGKWIEITETAPWNTDE